MEKYDGIRGYCKAFGMMMAPNDIIDIDIKPLEIDNNYYGMLQSDEYDMYKVNGMIKIAYRNKDVKTHKHIAYYIHSYIRTIILEQMLSMEIDDIFGVKLDSIVFKKNAVGVSDLVTRRSPRLHT